uniref:Uncharacterized protein n=1 Tax=Porphyridium purpureum TaxID=35688 RepID=W0RYT2_PORPP|nr:hypothetical protein Y721_p221 [Porphyridium purpureum]BAO23587.1 hypothetical protein [Porphyridium purpureum]
MKDVNSFQVCAKLYTAVYYVCLFVSFNSLDDDFWKWPKN